MLAPALDLARETFRALIDLVLALPRHICAWSRRSSRLAEFNELTAARLSTSNRTPASSSHLNRIFISCGDASGESHALALAKVLVDRNPGLQIAGFGGKRLKEFGMEVWEPLADLNVMGFADVASQLPLFLRCVTRFSKELKKNPPDAIVLVDYPGLNRHLLRIATRTGVPVIHHIAPQLWAWAPWRIKDFSKATKVTTILPFEDKWYQSRGTQTSFVGHPLGDQLCHAESAEASLPSAIEESRPWIGILPGSRRREIRNNLPSLLQAASLLRQRNPNWGFVLPHLRPEVLKQAHPEKLPEWVVEAPGCWHSILPRLSAAWVTSGTAVLEVAAHGVPPVIVYQIPSRLGAWLAKNALAVPHIASLNLIAGESISPEHVGNDLDIEKMVEDIEALVQGPKRKNWEKKMESLKPLFAEPGAANRTAYLVEEIASSN